jgi:hypothetical protein
MAVIQELGGRIEVASTQGSIYGAFRSQNGTTYYPLHLGSGNRVTLSLGYLLRRPKLAEESARRAIYDTFSQAVGPLSTANLQGYPGFLVSALSVAEVCEKFRSAAS